MQVTSVKFTAGEGIIDNKTVVAKAAVTFDDSITVTGFSVVRSNNGYMVYRPKNGDTKAITFKTKELRNEIYAAIKEKWVG